MSAQAAGTPGGSGKAQEEIERKFLLDSMPAIPAGADVWRIEQGYLNPHATSPQRAADGLVGGRLRRVTLPDGTIECTHTIKSGIGMVRMETERVITPDLFARHWPATAGRRLAKTRHRVRDGQVLWEIDVFDQLDLILAEVELPSANFDVALPPWVRPHIAREVTDDPFYTNAAIAARIATGST